MTQLQQGTLFSFQGDRLVPITSAPFGAAVTFDSAPAEAGAVDGYHAEQQSDGSWTIRDVPVFSVHTDERGPEPEVYDAQWLTKAVGLAKAREASDGYMGPLHKQHHPNPTVEAAGKFRLTGVRMLQYEGKPTPTIFADFVEISDAVYQEIKSGAYPYRSVEIPGPDQADVLSIALLDHEVPYFRYANMRISRETKAARKRSALVSRCYDLRNGGHSHFTFRYQEEAIMPAEPKTFTAGEVMSMLSGIQDGMAAMAEQVGAAMAQLSEGEGAPPAQEDDAVELRKAKPGESSFQADEEEDEDEKRSAFQEADKDDEDEDEKKSAATGDERVAALEGELAAVRQQLAEVTTAQASGSAFADVVEQFRVAGAPEKDVDQLKALNEKSGLAAAKAYARARTSDYRNMVAPPPHGFASTGELPKPSAFPPEVVAYQAAGPDAFAEAQRLYTTWASRKVKRHPLDTYLAAHLEPGKFFNGKTAYAVK